MGDPRFKYIETKVGLFVVVAVAAIILTFVAVGINRDLFVSKVNINVYTKTGEGVSKGMTVKYSGFAISRVDDVRLQDDGRVVIKLGIPQNYVKWIKQDSVFRLSALSIIGSGDISIETNLESTEPNIVDGSSFELQRNQDVQALIDQATPVVEDLSEIVSNINVIIGRVADEDGDVNKLLRGIGSLGDDLSKSEGSLGFLVRSTYIADEIKLLLEDVREFRKTALAFADNAVDGSVAFRNTLRYIDNNSTEIVDGTTNAAVKLDEITSEILLVLDKLDYVADQLTTASDSIVGGTTDLEELRAETQNVIKRGNDLLLQLQTIWPLSPEEIPTQVPLK